MKHYLNVCDVNGADVEPVDVITFGSPCQDLSVAGKRAGLKHESNGDDETTRSGLFMEAVRIIKEMREKDGFERLRSGRTDGHIRPRFAVWENVPGAFSSNKGEDFRVVLEELARIKDAEVSIPLPEKGKWKQSGEIVGDGWSIAWRTLDAQYHGVPQRRRRIFLVADFADECAGEILFECQGMPGYPAQSCEKGQGVAGDSAEGIRGTSERNGIVPYTLKIRSGCEGGGKGALIQTDKSATLAVAQDQTLFQPVVMDMTHANDVLRIYEDGVVPCLQHRMGTGGNQIPLVAEPKGYAMQAIGEYRDCNCASSLKMRDYKDATDLVCEPVEQPVFALDRTSFNQGENAQYDFQINDDGIAQTLVAKGPGAVSYYENVKYIVRRLTPTECARLQGMPDAWCRLSQIQDMSEEDYEFWKQAHKKYAEINEKPYKEKTKTQMIAWYNKLQIDGAEYKAYGNGMALPCVRVPIHGIAQHGAKTMASLFDGIGGFPLAGLIDGIQTLWTSEIELFPIAVTMERFREFEKYGCFTFGYEGSNANILIEKEKEEMQLKISEVQLPEKIDFNYEELKQELQERISHYETMVYTDEQIKEAKADKANLNKLKKALNDERIRLEKEYMVPFNDFKTKVNEIISIIDKPVAVIDTQVKSYEEKKKQEKFDQIKEMWNEMEHPETLTFDSVFQDKFLNTSTSMKVVKQYLEDAVTQFNRDMETLSNLPEFSFEATEVYKTTLSLNNALNEAHRLSEVAKKKVQYEAEQARLAAEAEAKKQEETVVEVTTVEAVCDGQAYKIAETSVEVPAKQWVRFQAFMTTEDALALKAFFEARNIEFKAV